MTVLQELQNYTFVSKYARWIKAENRRETWKEAVDRVRGMMLEKYADKEIDDTINWAYDMMYKKKVLGSQRCLQFGGEPIAKKNTRLYNCSASYCDRPRVFQEALFILLCGAGVGLSIQKHHVKKLPKLRKYQDDLLEQTYIIPDTIEGWSDALGALVNSYFENDPYVVVFDYSKIRPKGSYLSSGTGKAPGPEPLRNALENIRTVLDRCVRNEQHKLKPIDCCDIICHASDAVLSGGIRRSSCIMLFSPDDEEMMSSKTGTWFVDNPQRARANNSVVLLRSETTLEQFADIMQKVKEFGEPGFYLVDNEQMVTNPCSEIGFYCKNKQGQSGWGFCNLSTVNCGTLKDKEDLFERCRAAAIIGTLQAGFTDFDYLGDVTKEIVEQEALLGVSMTGIMENSDVVFTPGVQRKAARIVKEVNKEFAQKIGINQAARTTALKPEGSTSCLLGTSSGIHPHHAKRYIRRTQNNGGDIVYQYFKRHNPQATEVSVWGASGTDENILFPIEVPDGSKTKNQVPAIEMLKIIRETQQNWIAEGKNEELCVKPWLSHSVSNTCIVKEDEWDRVTRFIYNNKEHFAGISFLSDKGDKDYQQAPFTSVHTSHEIVREYGDAAIWCSGLIELALQAFDDNLWNACTFILNNGTIIDDSIINGDGDHTKEDELEDQLVKARLKTIFRKKFKKYACKYFECDVRRLTYCLKDVYNWKLYCDLNHSFKKVDYTTMLEFEDNTKPEQEISCAGGACLL